MPVNPDLLLLLKSSTLGEGEPDLGEKLLNAFLTKLWESGQLPAKIILMNSAIFLSTEGSSLLELLQKFASAGSEILSCGTCLNYYGRKDKLIIGTETNMQDTVHAMLSFKKIINP